jgi:hypothetical protein
MCLPHCAVHTTSSGIRSLHGHHHQDASDQPCTTCGCPLRCFKRMLRWQHVQKFEEQVEGAWPFSCKRKGRGFRPADLRMVHRNNRRGPIGRIWGLIWMPSAQSPKHHLEATCLLQTLTVTGRSSFGTTFYHIIPAHRRRKLEHWR